MSKRKWDKSTAKHTRELERFIKGKQGLIRYYLVDNFDGDTAYFGTNFDEAVMESLYIASLRNCEIIDDAFYYIDIPKSMVKENMTEEDLSEIVKSCNVGSDSCIIEAHIPYTITEAWYKEHFGINIEIEWYTFVEDLYGSYVYYYNLPYSCEPEYNEAFYIDLDKWIENNKTTDIYSWKKQYDKEKAEYKKHKGEINYDGARA